MKDSAVKEAIKMRKRAVATYSNYTVGAAVVTKTDEIIGGCNVESSSYGLTCCAERIAIYNACLLYTSPSPRDGLLSRMPSSA